MSTDVSSIKFEIGKRIQESRKKNKLSAVELAAITGFTKQRISNWENGRRTPGLEEAKILEDALGIPASYLLCIDVEDSYAHHLSILSKDVFYKIPLFKLEELVANTPANNWLPIPPSIEKSILGTMFGLLMPDNSMFKLFREKDIVVFQKNLEPVHDDIVLLQLKNEQMMVRKIYFDNSSLDHTKIILKPINGDWPIITLNSDVDFKIIGVHKKTISIFF